MKILTTAAFCATIPAANWLIGNVGTVCIPNGPCLIPVAPSLTAPSGVLMIGLALVLRDFLHEIAGSRWVIGTILAGALLSFAVAPPYLALASGIAFLLSEMADMAVYTPLRQRRLATAVFLSGIAGSLIDSAVFLLIAFGNLDYLVGQFVGKMWMTAFAIPLIFLFRGKMAR